MMHCRFDFAGAQVVVVGASRAGIGAAIARAFQEAGASVEITGAEAEPAPEDAARFAYSQLDVTDGVAVKEGKRSPIVSIVVLVGLGRPGPRRWAHLAVAPAITPIDQDDACDRLG